MEKTRKHGMGEKVKFSIMLCILKGQHKFQGTDLCISSEVQLGCERWKFTVDFEEFDVFLGPCETSPMRIEWVLGCYPSFKVLDLGFLFSFKVLDLGFLKHQFFWGLSRRI